MGDRRQPDGRVYGIRSFLPHIRAHGEGGHIVNTASMAGMNGGLGFSPYTATKIRRGRDVGRALDPAQATWHRGQRALPELRAHSHRRERTQPPAALWRDAAARSGDLCVCSCNPGGGGGVRLLGSGMEGVADRSDAGIAK